jgi:hypothetical protein
MAYRLWRISLDQRRNVPFEYRRRLAVIAEEFEARGRKLDRQIAEAPANVLDRKLAAD